MGKLVKLRIPLIDAPVAGENLWAEKTRLGNGRIAYVLENIPVFATGVNYQDIVSARRDEDRVLTIERVLKRSGNNTITLLFDASVAREDQVAVLEDMKRTGGCTFERFDERMVGVNVPCDGDVGTVLDIAERLENEGRAVFQTSFGPEGPAQRGEVPGQEAQPEYVQLKAAGQGASRKVH